MHLPKQFDGRFYVMRRYDGSLRTLTDAGINKDAVLKFHFQMLGSHHEAVHVGGKQPCTLRQIKGELIVASRRVARNRPSYCAKA